MDMNRVHIIGDGFECNPTIEFVATEFRATHYRYNEVDPDVLEDLSKATFIIACYENGDYCGDAYVLYGHGGNLYEVEASHCSCYGLEGQWNPVQVEIRSVLLRVNQGKYLYEYDSQIKELIKMELFKWLL